MEILSVCTYPRNSGKLYCVVYNCTLLKFHGFRVWMIFSCFNAFKFNRNTLYIHILLKGNKVLILLSDEINILLIKELNFAKRCLLKVTSSSFQYWMGKWQAIVFDEKMKSDEKSPLMSIRQEIKLFILWSMENARKGLKKRSIDGYVCITAQIYMLWYIYINAWHDIFQEDWLDILIG